jgi:ATP-binding cassette subfamily D (ALD) long-chain fatty acid import protein
LGGVDGDFVRKLSTILAIVMPGWRSREAGMICLHTVFLIARTYLSVVVARLDGRIVKDLASDHTH